LDAVLRNFVRDRAENRCEYCRTHQEQDSFFQFHCEHIIARQHGGPTVESNLAWACHHCNLHKGPNLTGIDPGGGGAVVLLFNPREQVWSEHFIANGPIVSGVTPTGRATVRVLDINAASRVQLRVTLGRNVSDQP
jgi:hypothetical protein